MMEDTMKCVVHVCVFHISLKTYVNVGIEFTTIWNMRFVENEQVSSTHLATYDANKNVP